MLRHWFALLTAALLLASPLLASRLLLPLQAHAQTSPAQNAPAQTAPSQTAPAQTTPAPVQTAPIAAPRTEAASSAEKSAADKSSAEKSTGLHELSPWSMFMNADVIVKGVMLGLAFASAVTWTVFIAKTIELAARSRRLKLTVGKIAYAHTLDETYAILQAYPGLVSKLVSEAIRELQLSANCLDEAGVKERAASLFSEITRSEGRSIRRGTGLLATIGSTAPFVGLFGTVWGIMNSFIGISKAQTTNLAVVAPGIAEALLATAIGLVAAIPAVIIYNHFSRTTKTYLDLVGVAVGTVTRILSRDIDRQKARHAAGE